MSNFVRAVGTLGNVKVHPGRSAHVVITLNISDTSYEVDINAGSKGSRDDDQYYNLKQTVSSFDYQNGIQQSHLNYKQDFNLTDNDFQNSTEKVLASLIENYAKASENIIVYGTEWNDSNVTGIHDIHMKSSNDQSDNDGAIGFYSSKPSPNIQWIFVKFAHQHIN